MSTTTTNYGLIKPDTTDPILIGQLNDNADIIDATLKSLSDVLDVAKLGIKYKGEVNYYSNLPASGNEIGDAYTVKYAGSSGTTPDGTEYVWGTVSGTNQWINFSKDSYTKAEVDALLALKQNALTTAQLDAVNSGIDSTKVEQIETNKNNISYNTDNGVKNTFDFANALQEANIYTTVSKTATSLTVTANNPCAGSSSVVYSGKDYPAGSYIFSCNITNYNCTTETAKIYIATSTAAGTGVANKLITGDGVIQIPFHWNGGKVYIKYFPNESNTINQSNTFTASENMIMPASISDTTYQPYTLSNVELTNNISYLENTGKKNWLKPYTISDVPTGITVQYESDDSITINGTYSGSKYAYVHLHSFAYEAMQYTLSCNVATSSSTFYFFTLDNKMATTFPPTYTYTENGTTRIVMRIAPNTSFDNVNVKLMIRPSIIADSTYQPYAMSNAELTVKEQQNENNILLLEQANGAKNALNISTIEKSSNITTTLNSDKTITLSVTSANARSYVYINGASYIQNVYSNYILVWDNGGNQAINCGVTYSNNGTSWANESFNNTGSSIEINSNYQYLRFSMYFEANTAITNATVKIMLITKSAYNAGFTDYQPYAMSNAELTAAIQALQAQLANQ